MLEERRSGTETGSGDSCATESDTAVCEAESSFERERKVCSVVYCTTAAAAADTKPGLDLIKLTN